MSGALVNRVRRDFYLDSIALMRMSQELSAERGVVDAALMIGSESNKRLLGDGGLLADEGRSAGPNDLIVAVRADDEAAAVSALGVVDRLIEQSRGADSRRGGQTWRPRSIETAAASLPDADLALISVPGEFAAAEARKALALGLHAMIFSDNVPLAEERALKEIARERGLLVMGPDCGTALIGGVPLAFANEVPPGDIGIVSASGTGLQEVSCLIARAGRGISHGIGVGGRDLSTAIGALSTLSALDALAADPNTKRIVLISKPPAESLVRRVLERVAQCGKPVSVCFLAHPRAEMPANARQLETLRDAAADALGVTAVFNAAAAARRAQIAPRRGGRRIVGLFCGGTLCSEAQIVLRRAGVATRSNVPLPGARNGGDTGHEMLDLGADEYTLARPHPMIDPAPRNEAIRRAIADPSVGVIVLDIVLGYGAHGDPAGAVVAALVGAPADRPFIVASVTGTNGDPQRHGAQAARLEAGGVLVAPSNADAAALALELIALSG